MMLNQPLNVKYLHAKVLIEVAEDKYLCAKVLLDVGNVLYLQ